MSPWSGIRAFWDEDAATYDQSVSHNPVSATERAAWLSALEQALPPAPAKVLDIGAGTGFLSLQAAALGHVVSAIDIAPAMLERLSDKARDAGVEVATFEADATSPPEGPFDAVIERHVLWTLPDPVAALSAWRAVVPNGRLVLFESIWGSGADLIGQVRAKARSRLSQLRRSPSDHHDSYPDQVRSDLPFGHGPKLADLIAAVEQAGWHAPRLTRLSDIEWAISSEKPLPERIIGGNPWFVIVAKS